MKALQENHVAKVSNHNRLNMSQKQNPNYTESISSECTKLRLDYDNCFNKWFKDVFLANDGENDLGNEKICEPEFNKYHECLFKAIAKIDEESSASATDSDGKPRGLMESIKEAEKEVLEFEKKK